MRSLTGPNPRLPPSGRHLPAPPLRLKGPGASSSRTPTGGRMTNTSPPRRPAGAGAPSERISSDGSGSPPQRPRRHPTDLNHSQNFGSDMESASALPLNLPWTPTASPLQLPGGQPINLKHLQNINSDSELEPEEKMKTSGNTPTTQFYATSPAAKHIPTTSGKRKKRATESRDSLSPLQPHPHIRYTEPSVSESKKKRRRKNKGSNKCVDQEETSQGVIREEASQEKLENGMEREEVVQDQLSDGLGLEELSQEQLGSDSSTWSSPLREPQAPLMPIWTAPSGKVYHGLTDDQAVLDKYYKALDRYEAKQARQEQLLTLESSHSISNVMESFSPLQKQTFLTVAKSLLKVSAYHDGKEINQCTGVIIEWDEVKSSGIILTSAWLICTKKPFDDWSEKEYAPESKVNVHLLDGTTLDTQLLYLNKHYDVAFYEILGGSNLQVLQLKPNLEYDLDFCTLARDNMMNFICKRVKVHCLDPCKHQHNHYRFIDKSISKCGSGGALADLNGNMVGMLLHTTAFVPSSLILRCLGSWKKFGQVARPQLGLKLRTVSFINMQHLELLSRTYGVTSGLIVGEVSVHCVAERLGIRTGDIILSCQGQSVSTVAQLEESLLDVGEKHLEASNDLSLKVDLEVGVFHVRKRMQRIVRLTVDLSDGIEVFRSG